MRERGVVVVDAEDNVATAVKPIKAGQSVFAEVSGAEVKVEVVENIPPGHKVALKDLKPGELVIKFGEPIARATCNIRRGSWVHTHNAESIRTETAKA